MSEQQDRTARSLTPHFFLLSTAICALSVWVVVVETHSLRPWKTFQEQYSDLQRADQESRHEEALVAFNSPSVQRQRAELQEKLARAAAEFRQPAVQQNYRAREDALREVRKALRRNRDRERSARGRLQEQEYIFSRSGSEAARERMAALEIEIAAAERRRGELQEEEANLIQEMDGLTAEITSIEAELALLESELEVATDRLARLDENGIALRQTFLEDADRVDRCQSCHVGIDDPVALSDSQPLARHPGRSTYLGNHPVEEFGCTVCHRGQGRATSSTEKAHGHEEHWEEPLLTGRRTQAACQTCHGDLAELKGGELASSGQELVSKLGCFGCHKIAGFETLRKVGPELTEVGTKANYSWLVEWILDPSHVRESARMPRYGFSQAEAEAIADYLTSITETNRLDRDVGEIDWELAETGRGIWGQSRCSLCHATDGVGGAFEGVNAPDLGTIGSKANRRWLSRWIRDPKSYFPDTTMPRFRFSDTEIKALVEFLVSEYVDWDFEPRHLDPVPIEVASVERGKALVRDYGCFGCHDIKGMEQLEQIGPFLRLEGVTYLSAREVGQTIGDELSSIGSKPLEQFDFGALEDEISHQRYSYFRQKLAEPRSFRPGLRMPQYRLTAEEVDALATLLLGFRDEEIPARMKVPASRPTYQPTGGFERIADDVKCFTCHMIGGVGEPFAPDLSIEGSKVQESWLRRFMAQPDIIRPMLKQMPRFNLDRADHMIQGNLSSGEIETIVQHFVNVLVSNEIPETLPENGLNRPQQIEVGRVLYLDKGCMACHQIGAEGGAVGPNLTTAGLRLTEGYVFKHLEDPAVLTPGIVEPNYGLSTEERVNLTRYIMSLRGGN
jgi:mono/diheme cytochrome c family protein/predicted  nucleic acid-binding Zn-ribbon protein